MCPVGLAFWHSQLGCCCDAGTPYRRRLLYLWSSSLLMAGKTSGRWPKCFNLCRTGDADEAPGSWIQLGPVWLLWPSGEWTSGWKIFLIIFKRKCCKKISVYSLFHVNQTPVTGQEGVSWIEGFFFSPKKTYLKERGSLPKCPQQLGLGLAQVRSQELYLGLS